MTANEPKPDGGHEAGDCTDSEGIEWETVGRELLAHKIRDRSEAVHNELYELSRSIDSGESVTEEDLRNLSEAGHMLTDTLELLGANPWKGKKPQCDSLSSLIEGDD